MFYRQIRDPVVKQLLKFDKLYYINCTVSSSKNLRPDDGLTEKERNMHTLKNLHHSNK